MNSDQKERIADYARTDAGRLARYRTGRRRRLAVLIHDVEPGSKNMPADDKLEFQRQVAETLSDSGRSAFLGDIALEIRLETAHRNPPQAHSIAKNLLDLLGKQGPSDKQWRKTRLYRDDSQIRGLSVSCVHGQDRPSITVIARPFGNMVDEIELAAHATQVMAEEDFDRHNRDDDWIESFRRLLDEEADQRARGGDELYEAMIRMERFYAQRAFLSGRSAVSIPVLGWLYGRPAGPFMQPLLDPWPALISRSGLRIQVGALPARSGELETFKQGIDAALADFERRWSWLISPLVVPVGLQVLVRPVAATPQHDLDNIVRDYLLPRIVPKFRTVTDHKWTIDFEELKRTAPDVAKLWGDDPLPPKGTKSGVTGYDIWRLPPAAAGEPGFVSVSMTAQPDFDGGVMQKIDRVIGRWDERSDAKSSRSRSGASSGPGRRRLRR